MAVILWAVASYGFSFYLSNFANYNEVYGSIGAAIAMLMWLFISAFLILLGAVVGTRVEIATGTTQVEPGQRCVVFATPERVGDVEPLFSA